MKDALKFAQKTVRKKSSVYEQIMANEAILSTKGFHKMSPWWKKSLRDFYRNSTRKRLVLRVGRRGGKSSTLARVAVAELMAGGHTVPTGDVAVFAFVSVKKAEARERLNTICHILQALGIGYVKTGDEVRIEGRPLCFRVYAASYRTAVGMTCCGIICDEVSRWRDEETGANPAREVLASIRPSMATMTQAREFLSSSPWSTLDAHHDAFEIGNTDEQMVAHAPTWVANPNISFDRCCALEPDEALRDREYGAIPMSAGLSAFFDPQAIEDAVEPGLPMPRVASEGEWITAGADFGFRRDSSAIVVCHRSKDGAIYRVADMLELKPSKNMPLKPSETVRSFASVLKRHELSSVMADGHYREAISEHLIDQGMGLIDSPAGSIGNTKVYVNARMLFHQGRVRIPDNEQIRRDLIEIQHRPTASGAIRIILPRRQGGGHADLVSALVLALWQKGGRRVPHARKANKGWTLEELDTVAAYERELRGKQLVEFTERQWITEDNSNRLLN